MRWLRWLTSVRRNRRGDVPRPSWLTYLVTYRCNARCGMCDSWKLDPGRELSVEEVDGLFRQLKRLDVVRFSGGEPFLRKDLPDLAGVAMRRLRPAGVAISTNGSFPDRVLSLARGFAAPKRLWIQVSLDGLPATHDANRGAGATFEKAMATLHGLTELRDSGVTVSVNHTVISDESMDESRELQARLDEIDVPMHTVLAYEDSAMYGQDRNGSAAGDLLGAAYPLHPAIDRGKARRFAAEELERAEVLKDRGLRRAKRYYLTGLLNRLGEPPRAFPDPRCVALRSHLRLLPDGSVPVCQFNTNRVGNAVDEGFERLWHGESCRKWRRWVDACDGCWAECEVLPSAIYTGDLLRALGRPEPARLAADR